MKTLTPISANGFLLLLDFQKHLPLYCSETVYVRGLSNTTLYRQAIETGAQKCPPDSIDTAVVVNPELTTI